MIPDRSRVTLAGTAGFGDEIAQRCTKWRRSADRAVIEVAHAVANVVEGTRRDGSESALAYQALYIQATNDFRDVMYDVSVGRGRPAMRSARTMFELQVAALDVTADPEAASRWLDHLPTTTLAESGLVLVEEHTLGNARRSLVHRSRRARVDSSRALDTAVQRWGSGFRRSWHPKNLFERATEHGLERHYDFYRFASAPTHGSRGALRGLERRIDEQDVIRVGPALALTPVACLYATWSMRAIVQQATPFLDTELDAALAALAELDAHWPDFNEEITRLDAETWPEEAPATPGALHVMASGGRSEWYEYLPDQQLARRARSPRATIHDAQNDAFNVLCRELGPLAERRPIGIHLEEAAVDKPGNGPWIDAAQLIPTTPFRISTSGSVGHPADFELPDAPSADT